MSTTSFSCPAQSATGANITPALCPHSVGQDTQNLIDKTCSTCRPIVESIINGVKDLHHKLGRTSKDTTSSAPGADNTCPVTGATETGAKSEAGIAPYELAAMKEIFELFDEDKDGFISISDLAGLHKKLGEPISDIEAKEAVSIISNGSNSINFDDFVSYWDGTHFAQKDDSSEEGLKRRRTAYQAKFKFMKARIPNPAIARVFTESTGPFPSLEYRVNFYYAAPDGKVQISPWHDIPLFNTDGTYNMVVEIPKWTRKKFEIATGEPFNPIKQDTKNGVLRNYNYGDMLFNYGAFPQTWEDPNHVTPDTNAPGDNDPVDVVEVGSKRWETGSIVRVKILGVLALIDDGETDWKVVAISAEDPLADRINDINDLEVHIPGAVDALREWLRLYKSPSINQFAFDGEAKNRSYAVKIIEETHQYWKNLILSRGESGDGSATPVASINAAGLTRSQSKHALNSLCGASSPQ